MDLQKLMHIRALVSEMQIQPNVGKDRQAFAALFGFDDEEMDALHEFFMAIESGDVTRWFFCSKVVEVNTVAKDREGAILCTGKEILEKYRSLVGTAYNVCMPYGHTRYWSVEGNDKWIRLYKKCGKRHVDHPSSKELALVPIEEN